METPIVGAIIIASAGLLGVVCTVVFKYWRIRTDRRIKTQDDFVTASKKLIAVFEPAKKRITNYRNHKHFFELTRFLTQQFPKHRDAVQGFLEHLPPDQIEGFNKAWSKYHGNDEKNPNFLQYQGHVPGGLLSRIEEILKFTK